MNDEFGRRVANSNGRNVYTECVHYAHEWTSDEYTQQSTPRYGFMCSAHVPVPHPQSTINLLIVCLVFLK